MDADELEFADQINSALGAQGIAAGVAISRIECLVESLVDSLKQSEPLTIELAPRRGQRRGQIQPVSRAVHFPGRTAQEVQRFARVLLILQVAHDALVCGTILTKRNIFYQNQALFETQRAVDELVDDIAVTLRLDRHDMNIVASAKGIVAGPLDIQLDDGKKLNASSGTAGIIIPSANFIARMNTGAIRWVLVIEKDATFRSLVSSHYWRNSACGKGLLITAKGYPDMITQAFLRVLSRCRPDIPILVLVDFDPDGINIFRCYLYGSGSLLFNSEVPNPSISWLGIRSCHLTSMHTSLETSASCESILDSSQSSYSSKGSSGSTASTNCQNSTLALTSRDQKAIIDSLERLTDLGDDLESAAAMRHELQRMQMIGCKAEIQMLDDSGDLTSWLDIQLHIAMCNL